MVRILIVESFPATSDVIHSTLAAAPGMDVVGQAKNSGSALAMLEQLRPDLVIVDGTLGHRDSHRLIRRMKEVTPTVKLLVLSDHPEASYHESAVTCGADRLILKVHLIQELLPAVRSVIGEPGTERQPR